MTNEQIESAIEYALQIATTGNEEEIETIIEALEKQTPKKPIVINKTLISTHGKCPNCETNLLSNDDLKYCWWCGQKLDWS